MKIILSRYPLLRQWIQEGKRIVPPEEIEIDPQAYERNLAEWDKSHKHSDQSRRESWAIYNCWEPEGQSEKETGSDGDPLRLKTALESIHAVLIKQETWLRLIFFGDLVLKTIGLILLWLLMAAQSSAQGRGTSFLDCITFLNAAGAEVSAPCSPFIIREGTGITFSVAGDTTTITGAVSGATTALDNLAAVDINAALLPQTTLDFGSATRPWRDVYLYGAGTYGANNQRITSTAPTAPRIFTLPDADSNPVRPLTCGGTDKVSAVAATGIITCTADAGAAGGDAITVNTTAVVDPDFITSSTVSVTENLVPAPDTITWAVVANSIGPTHLDETVAYAFSSATNTFLGASFTGPTADPADAGVLRLSNGETICWEASPAGVDFCITGDASERIAATTFVGALVGNADTATTATTATTANAGDSATAFFSSGILEAAIGGTGNGFTLFSGPATTEKTYTLPNASTTILTTNAAVTAAQGGTGQSTTATLNRYLKGDGTNWGASTGSASGVGACAANNWASTLNSDAAPTCTQPAASNLSDGTTGTGSVVLGTSPTIATPVVTGKVDRNNVAVDDDDCTGEQGLYWYDTTDSAFEFCNANSGVPAVLGGGGGNTTQTHYLPLKCNTPRSSTLAGNSFWTVGARTDFDNGHWEFVFNTVGKIYCDALIPNTMAGTPAAAIVLRIGTSTISEVASWIVGTLAVADNESMNGTLTDEASQDITMPGTTYLTETVTFTLTNPPVALDHLFVEIVHDGDDLQDNATVNLELYGAWLRIDLTE